MKVSNNKKTYQSPEATRFNLNMSAHVLIGSDATSPFSVISNLNGMGGFGGGYNPGLGN